MKKFLLALAILTLAVASFAQTSVVQQLPNKTYALFVIPDTVTVPAPKPKPGQIVPQSVSYTVGIAGVGLVYLFDGQNSLAGIDVNALAISGNVTLNALVVTQLSSNSQIYLGTLLTYKCYDKGGLSGSVGIGWKGFDLSSGFSVTKYQQPLIFSVQATIPLTFLNK